MNQSPSEVIMIRPMAFGFNAETSQDNAFMNDDDVVGSNVGVDVAKEALREFDAAVDALRYLKMG